MTSIVVAQPAITYKYLVPGQIGKGEATAPDGSCSRFFLSDGKTLCVMGAVVSRVYNCGPDYVMIIANSKNPQCGFVTPNETFSAFTPTNVWTGGGGGGVNTFKFESQFTTMYTSETDARADKDKLTKTKAARLEKELTTLSAKDELKALKGDLEALKKEVETINGKLPEDAKTTDPMPKKDGSPKKKKDIDD